MATPDPILIVDDERDNLEALQRLLRNQYAITATTSPFEALKLIQKNHYHVIVSDQRMPEMTGVELLEKAKNVRPEAARILLTGYTDIDSVIGAINRGNIYRYVAKPWDPEDLKLTLKQANESVRLRQELDRKNAELTKSLEALQRLDRAKARFLSLISHELNTPLTVLNGFTALLTERKASFPDDIKKAVGSLSGASSRLSEIVGEVLTYVRLESDDRLHLAELDLSAELETARAAAAPGAAKRKAKLDVKTGGKAPVSADAEKLRLALRRLFDDAVGRSPEGGTVGVALGREKDRLVCTIRRQGEPVSEAAFEPLDIAGDPLKHHRNLGLSLAIAKLIVEAHGGEIGLGAGDAKSTTITFWLPAATPS